MRGRMTQRRLTDEKLMLAYQEGDAKAFEELFARYKTRLFNYLRRAVGNPMEAEDLFQTLFLRIHRAKETYRPKAAFSTWIYTIARNLVRDAMNKERAETERRETTYGSWQEVNGDPVAIEHRIADEHRAPETLLQRREIAARLQQALSSLSLEQREVILLSKYEGLRFQEIADILGCSMTAAKVRAFRALKALRTALGDTQDLC